MNRIICDICGVETSDRNTTRIILGIKIMGSPDYQDICNTCTYWMIKQFDKRRSEPQQ